MSSMDLDGAGIRSFPKIGFLELPVRAELCFYDVFGVACSGARLAGWG